MNEGAHPEGKTGDDALIEAYVGAVVVLAAIGIVGTWLGETVTRWPRRLFVYLGATGTSFPDRIP